MKINQISSIDSSKGDYLILTDYGRDGLHVSSQHKTVENAIKSFNSSEPQAVVKLVDVIIEEVN